MHKDHSLFICADTHFRHEKAAHLRGFSTVEEHDTAIIDAINSTVRKNDTLIIAGDITGGGTAGWPELDEIVCVNKRLVAGNHDPNLIRLSEYFISTHAYFSVRGYLISHIPIHPTFLERWDGNIHGHLHDKSVGDPRYHCVSMEHLNDFKPVRVEDVIESMKNNFSQKGF